MVRVCLKVCIRIIRRSRLMVQEQHGSVRKYIDAAVYSGKAILLILHAGSLKLAYMRHCDYLYFTL